MRQTAVPIETLEDLIHGVINSLSLISSHSQYLLGKWEATATGRDELQVIYDEAERAARLLGLVPQGLARIPIQETETRTPPEARISPRGAGEARISPRGAGGAPPETKDSKKTP